MPLASVIVEFTPAQAKLVRDLLDTYLDSCHENARPGRTETKDARIARAAIRAVRKELQP